MFKKIKERKPSEVILPDSLQQLQANKPNHHPCWLHVQPHSDSP